MNHDEPKGIMDFDALKLSLASPEKIREWGHGEVTKPETVNYRTQKPEKDGLFCERIFGPSKDWECYCGKYKKIRYKGIICDKCGVEVTRSLVRRERMGYIQLASPCSHIWFLRGVPSRIGLLLDLSLQNLEKVIYFASFIITKVDEDLKKSTMEQIKQEFKQKRKKIDDDFIHQTENIQSKQKDESKREEQLVNLRDLKKQKIEELESVMQMAETELRELRPMKIISEHVYQDLSLKYGHIFEAGIGAEAIHRLLTEVNLEKLESDLEKKLDTSAGPVKDKLIKRIKLVKNLHENDIRPDWMILSVIPVIPPDLRPMVPLDGGRFATSDLNDLYRRIINRNNRLKQLIELNAPEVICRNEKRMLQEAVDALIDNNARHGKTVVASTGQKRMLKSLADILRGKQGRFRQNLLGKRIDYSGRSVIVVGPKLRLDQCGLPKKMALELFKPFIISRLIKDEYVHNVRSASHFIEAGRPEVWDILEEITKKSYVLLNRAPTLHRLGIQAFRPILIEGKAIQVHPLVCSAFNADFDGDQMAVHVPLTEQAKWEAENIMLSARNLLKPATGAPITNPVLDMVWGIYYMTSLKEKGDTEPKAYSSVQEVILVRQLGKLHLQEPIRIRAKSLEKEIIEEDGSKADPDSIVVTSVGRILFNQVLPKDYPYLNKKYDSAGLKGLIADIVQKYTQEEVTKTLDKVKQLGFRYLTKSGHSWGMDDVPKLSEKQAIIERGEKEVAEIKDQFDLGLLTDSERHTKIIETWMKIKDEIVALSRDSLNSLGPIYTMVESGARGSWSQLIQIMGMKGLVTNPAGEIIELPVKGNFKGGFDVLEYFISTHGARKGLSDTALRTANAGYLTRRLVDVSQDLVISNEDCEDDIGLVMTKRASQDLNMDLIDRVRRRFVVDSVVHPKTKKVIVKKGELIDDKAAEKLRKADVAEIKVRSVLNCRNSRGICKKCYGYDLGNNKLVETGTAVGIIAAQSIGEPGTQLTMRTFHTGGVAGLDITQGLPRVEEIFEARTPKVKAFIAEHDGVVSFGDAKTSGKETRGRVINITYKSTDHDRYLLPKKKSDTFKLEVKNEQKVSKGDTILVNEHGEEITAKRSGIVKLEDKQVTVVVDEEKVKEYIIPREFYIQVKDGDLITAGQALTDGSMDLRQLYRLQGIEETQRYVVKEIQNIYTSQGQKLNDKHIELIARKMFSRVYIKDAGDTDFTAGSRVEWSEFAKVNAEAKKAGKKEAVGERLLLGITKVSLSTSSFLSAASFQETSRVLINAAITGQIDHLEGLKENVIIGRLIPAGTGYKHYHKV